ncbi:hypothetical protein KCV01_g22086, partial [Aureobasidium melanogenum]
LRHTVRFSPALLHALEDGSHAFLEVGPRNALTQFARQHAQSRGRGVVASLSADAATERAAWLDAAGSLWSAGVDVDLAAVDHRGSRRRVRLPTYPFERKRHWIDARPPASVTAIASAMPAPPSAIPDVPEYPMPNETSPRSRRLVGELVALFEDVSGNDLAGASASASFVELGLDSLALTQVALQLQKTYGLKIAFRELMDGCGSFDALAGHIDRLLPAEQVAPAVVAKPATVVPPASGLVQDVIAEQMRIMQAQLALLAGCSVGSPTGSAPTTAVVEEEASLAHTTYDVKKAFGAIARIHSGGTELTARQRTRLDAFMRRYIERTKASKAYTVEHRDHLADPRVVNGFRPLLKEIVYQIVVERSKGSKVWDIDGNEYVDALNGFGMNLFGWQPDFVLDAVRTQLDAGYEIGPQHPLAGIVAKQVCDLTGFDRAALCNTGSEAVMGCVRVARTVTGRETLVIFTGSYHGIFDEVIVRGTKKLTSVPAAPGILRNTAEHVLVLEYGTPESLAIIRERAHEIAAVLVEPVQSRRPDFQPVEFLRELRAITEEA